MMSASVVPEKMSVFVPETSPRMLDTNLWVEASHMAVWKEQRVCIKFCYKLGKTASETHEMLKSAFGDQAMGKTSTYHWYSKFKNGFTAVEDAERSGRPPKARSNENVARISELLHQNRNLTVRDLADRVGVSYGTCHRILTDDLNTRRKAPKTNDDDAKCVSHKEKKLHKKTSKMIPIAKPETAEELVKRVLCETSVV